MTTMKTFLSGAAVAGLLLYIFDEELQPLVDSSKAFITGLFNGKETKEADGIRKPLVFMESCGVHWLAMTL